MPLQPDGIVFHHTAIQSASALFQQAAALSSTIVALLRKPHSAPDISTTACDFERLFQLLFGLGLRTGGCMPVERSFGLKWYNDLAQFVNLLEVDSCSYG
jgi:hypothetical protein